MGPSTVLFLSSMGKEGAFSSLLHPSLGFPELASRAIARTREKGGNFGEKKGSLILGNGKMGALLDNSITIQIFNMQQKQGRIELM